MNDKLFNEAKAVEQRWSQCGLLEGINDPFLRTTTTVLLENQRLANLYNETGTDTSDVARFNKISIPMIRRIYPQLIANKIVTVQPLLGPAGLVFYLRFRYATNKGATRGQDNAGFPGDDSNSLQQTASGDTNLDIFFTSSFIQNETSSTDDGVDTASVFSPLEHTPVIANSLTGTIYDGSVAIQTFVVSESGTFTFSDIGSPSPKVTGATVNVSTGEITMTWNSAPGSNYFVCSYDYNMECNQDLPEINMTVESEMIQSVTRKLKASWTLEVQQDLRSEHNLDAEGELTGVLAQEINLEIDREILNDLRLNAGTITAWDYNTAIGSTIKEKYESLYVKLSQVSAVIHRKTLRGDANWIVTSPEIASILETATAGYAPTPSETFTTSLGIQYVGTVSNKWKLYKDPNFRYNQLVMGLKGDSYMESGYFYCPYVPLTQTPVMMDPESACPKKAIMTRYGKKMLRDGAKYYARMSIANFSI